IKKRKSDAVIMLLLIAIATMFMYVGISVLGNYKKEIDSRNELNNGADYFYYTTSDKYEELVDIIKQNEHVVDSEIGEILVVTGKYRGQNETKEEAHETGFSFQKRDDNRRISKINVLEAGGEWKENSIILPYYLYVSEGYRSGDKIYFEEGDYEVCFEVYGFSEDVMFSNPMNIDVTKLVISDKMYEICCNNMGNIYHGVNAKLDGYDSEQFEKDMEIELASKVEGSNEVPYINLNYNVMKRGTGMLVSIFMAMLTMFAVLLIVVVLIIIKFNIGNSIEENIKNTGIMEACGYTSRQMMATTVLQFGILGVSGVVLGLVLSQAASSFLGNIISSSMGLRWGLKFSFASALLTLLVVTMFVILVAYVSSGKFRKISPLDALRNGIYSHNFKKNKLKLETSPFSINSSLGIKSTLFHLKKNIFICMVVVILTFVTNMAIAIFTNFLDSNMLLRIVGLERTDVFLEYKGDGTVDYKAFVKELETRDEVKKTNIYSGCSMTIVVGDKDSQLHVDVYADPSKIEIDMIADGRMPQFDNEVVLSTHVCKKYGLEIGDMVTIQNGDETFDYVIVGKNQGMARMGETGIMTMEGHKHLFPNDDGGRVYVYFKDGVDVRNTIEAYREIFGDAYVVTDYSQGMNTAISPVKMALRAFCFALIVVSAIVIALILVLLIKSHIIRERKQMGIYKALGYTTSQLIVQIMVSYLPVVLIGGLLGGVTTKLLIEKLFVLCFSAFSIEKITIEISFVSYVICIGGIMLWSELVALISSARIRKIMPYKMITE
ncbi:MAG: ABC transporter permease, partial [Lachnospiraceae bacterium]|nr:ABC transporter permease [Lachnospiraceae bacterium]